MIPLKLSIGLFHQSIRSSFRAVSEQFRSDSGGGNCGGHSSSNWIIYFEIGLDFAARFESLKYFFKLRLKLGEPQSVHSSGRFGALLRPVPECIFVSKMDLMQSLDMNSLKKTFIKWDWIPVGPFQWLFRSSFRANLGSLLIQGRFEFRGSQGRFYIALADTLTESMRLTRNLEEKIPWFIMINLQHGFTKLQFFPRGSCEKRNAE